MLIFHRLGKLISAIKKNETGDIVAHGTRGGKTKVIVQKGFGFKLPETFVRQYKDAIRSEAKSVIAQENQEIRETRQSLRDAETQLKEAANFSTERENAAKELQNLRTKLERTQASIDALQEEHGSNLESEAEL